MFLKLLKTKFPKIPHKYFSTLSYAIIGSGPAGLYTAKHLLKTQSYIKIHIYEKLPHPFGLVRTGVAPDHQDVKKVQNDFSQVLEDQRVQFLGNIDIGEDISLDVLRTNYSAIIIAYGAESENTLGIENEDAEGCYSARRFVNWYNGHILYSQDSPFNSIDFNQENVVIIGNGNVAVDVARILSKSYNELKKYDIPEYVLDKLANKRVKNIHIVARKEFKLAAFTIKEIKELSRVENVKMYVYKTEILESEDTTVDNHATKFSADRIHMQKKLTFVNKLEKLESGQSSPPNDIGTNIHLRFLLVPFKIHTSHGHVSGIDFKPNLPNTSTGVQHIDTPLIFKSIGYRSLQTFEDIEFDPRLNIIKNEHGLVYGLGNTLLNDVFTVGWVKRGAKGIIDSTLRDSYDTLFSINESLNKAFLKPSEPDMGRIKSLIEANGKRIVTYEDWKKVNEYELQQGERKGKAREKVTSLSTFFDVLDKKI
jgi:NADPH-dependent glutamate synthase beta subunit-like oxidoreductase